MLLHGTTMTGIHFVLFMSDYIIADGALGALAEPILAGRSAIFAPSWRANDAAVADEVNAFRTSDGLLAIPPRALARIALRHPHITVLAGMVDAGMLTTTHYNQFYWPVDEQTMLTRQYLMHLICLRPEVPLTDVDFFFDYGLFETCCPSKDHVVLTDSDQYMVLERQDATWQSDRIRLGATNLAAIAADVASWTTPVHRMLAHYTCVLHSAGHPASLDNVAARAQSIVDALIRRLPPPRPARGHPYWRGAVAAWSLRISTESRRAAVHEFRMADWSERQNVLARLRRSAIDRVFGRAPNFTFLHPRWLEYRKLRTIVGRISATRTQLILSSKSRQLFDALVNKKSKLREFDQFAADEKADAAILDIDDIQAKRLGSLLAAVDKRLPDTGAIILIVRRDLARATSTLNFMELMQVSLAVENSGWRCREIYLVGSAFGNALLALMNDTLVRLRAAPSRTVFLVGLLRMAWLTALTAMTNLAVALRPRRPVGSDQIRLMVALLTRQDQAAK
jgi:hypothetical protein